MLHMTRRQLLQTAGAGALALALSPLTTRADEKKKGGFTLPKLPYDFDALEPHIDAQTMEIHHNRHHKAYVDNLNKALGGHEDLQGKSITELIRNLNKDVPEKIRTVVRNNGGGHANHTMFWEVMAKNAGGKPSGALSKAIDKDFEDFSKFQQQFTQMALTRFGSGWAWLVVADGKLKVLSTPNQDSPLTDGQTPILGIDVWEHAYYLKYQNKRPDYVKAWWNVVNWDNVADRYNRALKD